MTMVIGQMVNINTVWQSKDTKDNPRTAPHLVTSMELLEAVAHKARAQIILWNAPPPKQKTHTHTPTVWAHTLLGPQACPRVYQLTGSVHSTAADPGGALIPQARHLPLQRLDAIQQLLQAWQVAVAGAGLPWDVDAVGEDDLVVTVQRVLGGAQLWRGGPGLQLRRAGGVQVHRAQRARGHVDVVDMVEDNRLIWVW